MLGIGYLVLAIGKQSFSQESQDQYLITNTE